MFSGGREVEHWLEMVQSHPISLRSVIFLQEIAGKLLLMLSECKRIIIFYFP